MRTAKGEVAKACMRMCPGACQTELEQWCANVKPGEGRLAKCMGDQLADEAKPGYKGTKTSAACGTELSRFRIGRSENINADLPLAKACKADADRLCATKYDVRAPCYLPVLALTMHHTLWLHRQRPLHAEAAVHGRYLACKQSEVSLQSNDSPS